MKILIVYDTKFGNNKQIAEFVAENLRNASHDVKVHHAREISQKEAFVFQPEIFLFGGPIRAGMVSFTIKRWVSRFSSLLRKKGLTLKTSAAWATHGEDAPGTPERFLWKSTAAKWEKLLAIVPASNKLPRVVDILVKGMEGPMEAGWQAKVDEYFSKITNL